MKTKSFETIRIKSSEIKKHDRITMGGSVYAAHSDSFIDSLTNCWSIDIGSGLTLGLFTNDVELNIKRPIK